MTAPKTPYITRPDTPGVSQAAGRTQVRHCAHHRQENQVSYPSLTKILETSDYTEETEETAHTNEELVFKKFAKEDPEAAKPLQTLFLEFAKDLPPQVPPPAASVAALPRGPVRKFNQEHVTKKCALTVLFTTSIAAFVLLAAFMSISLAPDNYTTALEGDEESKFSLFRGLGFLDVVEPMLTPSAVTEDQATANDTITRRAPVDYKVVCVYQTRSRHTVAMGREYNIQIFPFQYCDLAVFCCVTLSATYQLIPRKADDSTFYAFHSLATQNPAVRTSVIIGGLPKDDALLLDVITKADAGAAFVRNVKSWTHTYEFHGVHIYWPSLPESTMTDKITSKFNALNAHLSASDINLGVVMEQPTGTPAFDLKQLPPNTTVLLLPPTYKADMFGTKPFTYYAGRTISRLQKFALDTPEDIRRHLCVMLPAEALAFRLVETKAQHTSRESAAGPGPAGPFTRQKGHWSYYEACLRITNCTRSRGYSYATSAACGATWINYVTPRTVKEFICHFSFRARIGCYGIWDSDWDDYPAVCGQKEFPLLRAVFEGPSHNCDANTF
ncbi:acidic mammalian chitinase-like [Ornithodoros turicata]|uniref:acidic mammalian chitinase-like n=1 Tax=Ornithodoros turicata TaxID=34597 RepID=UPI0031388A3E